MMGDISLSKKTFGVALLLMVAVLFLGGCRRGSTSSFSPIHPNPNMDHQPKYRAQAASEFFYDGATMRPPVEGTVARGELLDDTALYEGRDEAGEFVTEIPASAEVNLERGAQRFDIYCTPCHGASGNGKGILWERAQIESRDLHEQRLIDMSDGELFDIITNGLGLMKGYRYPIPAPDRWAIIAYVRQIQESP
jgi:hypothetical protein